MRPSPGQLERVAERLIRRLGQAEFVTLTAGQDVLRAKIVALLTKNFDDEVQIEQLAKAEAEKLVRQGAPGVRREDLDTRKVELMLKQKLAKDRGFVL